jgi:hypothetical protein
MVIKVALGGIAGTHLETIIAPAVPPELAQTISLVLTTSAR